MIIYHCRNAEYTVRVITTTDKNCHYYAIEKIAVFRNDDCVYIPNCDSDTQKLSCIQWLINESVITIDEYDVIVDLFWPLTGV